MRGLNRQESGVRSRKRAWPVLSVLAVLSFTACKRTAHDAQALVPEPTGPLLSVVSVSDPAASSQLVRGFYGLEGNTWRWTAKQFEVALKPPAGATDNGAKLSFQLNVPGAIVEKFGLALGPETYSKPGNYVYSRDVPAAALKGDAVVVQFSSDKGIAPSADDQRELALVSVSIGLEPR